MRGSSSRHSRCAWVRWQRPRAQPAWPREVACDLRGQPVRIEGVPHAGRGAQISVQDRMDLIEQEAAQLREREG